MSRFLGQSQFSHGQPLRAGILFTNLGTPDAPTTGALRRYLKQFLSDPRVVELPRSVWWPILNLVILNVRPRRSAAAYRGIWTDSGSPLRVHTHLLAEALIAEIGARYPHEVLVKFAMRYGQPSIPTVLRQMHDAQVHRLLVLPMYPQYSGSTTGSTFDAVGRALQRWRWVPELRFVNGYHDEPRYIEALAGSVRRAWSENQRGELLLISFHGVPRRFLLHGDPYYCQCHATARLLAAKLGLLDAQWRLVFQSRFGREPWLQPYCDETLKSLPGQGTKSVDVVCPGFAVDCLETLEEIAVRYRELFRRAGGASFQYIPCLNDDTAHRNLMVNLVERYSRDWPEFGRTMTERALEERAARAAALGAKR